MEEFHGYQSGTAPRDDFIADCLSGEAFLQLPSILNVRSVRSNRNSQQLSPIRVQVRALILFLVFICQL